MHTGDLGVLLWFQGGVLAQLHADGPFRGSEEVRLKSIWDLIKTYTSRLGMPSRLTQLKTEMFKPDGTGWACLRHVKAAASQCLLY